MSYAVTADDANGMGMTILHILFGLGTSGAVVWLLNRAAYVDRRDHEFDATPLALGGES